MAVPQLWIYIYVGTEAPETCPACLHPQAYFEVKKNNY